MSTPTARHQLWKSPLNSAVESHYYPLSTLGQNASPDAHASHEAEEKVHSPNSSNWLPITLTAVGLLITTIISILLLIADSRQQALPSHLYRIIAENRASVQIVVQLLSNALALIWVSLVCTLINYAARIYLQAHSVELNTIRLWHSLCIRTITWSMPFGMLLLAALFMAITAIPSAIWAGALTPVSTTIQGEGMISIPAYHETSNIVEWPMEIDRTGPQLRSSLGFFTYSVGVQLQGSLLASASAATPVDGSTRQHQKLDYTRFNYFGRSYGVGASVGLTDSVALEQPLGLNYSYIESGYRTVVTCEHNATADFTLIPAQNPSDSGKFYEAKGELPNSKPGEGEDTAYVGHGDDKSIVAIGVGRNALSPVRQLGIAAGHYYQHLNKMQCTLNFQPADFNVSVAIKTRNITVTPVNRTTSMVDSNIHASPNLTQVLTRQFELIANDQTNFYVSLVGNSLNASIGDTITSQASSNAGHQLTLAEATPIGLSNSFSAMADDMLVAYASAQLMIENQTVPRAIRITSEAVRIGDRIYIQAVFGVNVVVLVLVLIELVRTKVWKEKGAFDFEDPAHLISGVSGGKAHARVGGKDLSGGYREVGGRVRVELRDGKVVECT